MYNKQYQQFNPISFEEKINQGYYIEDYKVFDKYDEEVGYVSDGLIYIEWTIENGFEELQKNKEYYLKLLKSFKCVKEILIYKYSKYRDREVDYEPIARVAVEYEGDMINIMKELYGNPGQLGSKLPKTINIEFSTSYPNDTGGTLLNKIHEAEPLRTEYYQNI